MGGIIGRLFGKSEEIRILLAGLDAAGKTTLLYRLKLGEVVCTIPTIGFNVETITHGKLTFTAWDVGSRDKMRPLMRHYFANTRVLIYVIDSNDHERMSEACDDFKSYLLEDELRDSLFLILANKQDLPNAKSPTAISEALELHKFRRHCHIIPTSGKTGDGLEVGLQWIAETLNNKRHLPKDSDQLKHASTKADNKNSIGYFGKAWELFYSLFVGSEGPDNKTMLKELNNEYLKQDVTEM